MNPLSILCALTFLGTAAYASPPTEMRSNIVSSSLKPSQWLTPSELEDIPALDEVSLEKLEQMPLEKGAKLMQKLYHISQINYQLAPSFVPSPSNIPVYVVKSNVAKQDTSFGDEEVTVIITGLPSTTDTVKKANRKLIEAYIERYNRKQQKPEYKKFSEEQTGSRTSSEETSSEWQNQKSTSGNLIVIDLGQTLSDIQRLAMLNVDETGAMIGKALVQLTNDCDVPQEIIHVVAQGVAAHVAGAAGDEYTRLTGHQLRRITALDPSKILAKDPKVLTGLARGDAEFVDAIHTSTYGMGTLTRVGDIDFFPNGPSIAVPGADNVVEATMRATRYFAETVRPGNERNFPAVEANSMKEYKNNNGFGKRAFMGIATDFDLRGDYILQVNDKSPFGMRTPAQKQITYHGVHDAWRQAASYARGTPSVVNKLRPSQWLPSAHLEGIPSIEEISLQKLENMAVEKGAELVEKIYHLSQINHALKPNFVPSPSNVPCYIVKPSGRKVTTSLDKLASTCKQQSNFGDEEVTIFITGLPATTESVKKANHFYPNGPAETVPGAKSIVEASMRATRYFAESVRPGNERNFPAVAANSLKQYKNNDGFGKRVYMGIDCDYDVEGDYMLEVNSKSPFGKKAPAQKQNTYHGVHKAWKNFLMSPLKIVSVVALILAVGSAHGSLSVLNKLRPSQWLPSAHLEGIPSIEEISLQKLENMAVEKDHLSQINHALKPNFVPSPSNVPCYIVKPSGRKVTTSLDKLASTCKQQSNFGDEEVTIFITGLPATTESVKKANRMLINAYLQRYNTKKQQPQKFDYSGEKMSRTSSEEDSSEWQKQQSSSGDLVIIDLGAKLNSFTRFALLDVEETGAMIASAIMDMTEKCDVADETVHLVAQGIAAHVAGAAGNEYTRQTGRQLRRITALDPSKVLAKNPHTLTGLSRGDAEFVDAIHTNVYGMGTIQRVGDVDFYPNGPAETVPGAKSIVEASMRATRYFAESVRPGNERNFPAVAANSLKQYKNNDGFGKRIYMGIDCDYDVEGDYMLEVNSKSPFGKKAPAQKQNTYHGVHKAWKNFLAVILVVGSAHGSLSVLNKLRPSQWLPSAHLEGIPSIEEISLQKLENMAVEKDHLSQINHALKPNFVPSPSNVPCYIVKPSGRKVTTSLDKLASTCKQQSKFGDEEVTIFITGLPATTESVKKANRMLINAYLQRYNTKKQQPQKFDYSGEKMSRTSSEEDSSEWQKQESSSGDLVIIDLGAKLNSFTRFALLDVEETGAMIASAIMDMTEKCDVADETVHLVAQGIAAHVAGAAGNEYTRQTGRQLRRITALDPSKVLAKNPHTLTGLSRGDAEFVDAIHTNVYGMGTIQRVGDVDFYPNGPAETVPGAKSIVEASMRATRYFAESVRPGNERNFPAVAANSLKQYKNNDGFGKRVYMGIDCDYDVEGDYMLEVNSKSPFGKRAPAQKQNTYHGVHKAWKNFRDNE
ncbi:hypothetical protein FF38_11008 [Lucilia cuprina]|uniref:Lipase domain-containing protein n=1 Tax=Lucilia cuprina TaxID=7375 RepID=A0A0L0C1H9_LUCCU|nr:hypothetical protein FF38_11008 [Lucilia cuprina]